MCAFGTHSCMGVSLGHAHVYVDETWRNVKLDDFGRLLLFEVRMIKRIFEQSDKHIEV